MARRELRRWRWPTVAALWVGYAIGAVTNIASASLPKFVKSHQAWFWLVLLVLITLATYLMPPEEESDDLTRLEKAPPPSPSADDRTRALKRVREKSIGGLNEKLGDHPPLSLALAPMPDRVPEKYRSSFEDDTATVATQTCLQAYDRCPSMSLLGAAGAGKTTLLLRLAEDLLARAEKCQDEPIPFVISLSGWGRRRPSVRDLQQTLGWQGQRLIRWFLHRKPPPRPTKEPPKEDLVRWLTEGIEARYRVTSGAAQRLLTHRQAVLLLDGLDECAEDDARDRFVTEFGRLVASPRGDPLVVLSCRTPDFDRLADQPTLRSAWTVQPLTWSQIEPALDADMREALHQDTELLELLSAPIWLTVIRRLNHWPQRIRDKSVSAADRGLELLDAFLTEIFSRPAPALASPSRMRRWVAQLARLVGAAEDPDLVDLRAPTREARIPSSALFPVVVRAVPVLLVIPFALGFVLPLARLYGVASAAHAIIQPFAYLGILILACLASGLVPGYDRASVPTRRRRRWLTFGAVLTSVVLGLLGFGVVVGFHALAVTSMDTVRWVLVAGFALPAAVLLLRSRTARLRGIAAGLAALSVASLFVPTMAPDEFTYGVAGAFQGILLLLPVLAVLAARGLSVEGFRSTPAMLVVVPLTIGLGLAVGLIPWVDTWLNHSRGVLGQPVVYAIGEGWLLAAACLTGLVFLLGGWFSTSAGRLSLGLADHLPWRLPDLLAYAESSGLFIKSAAGYHFAHPLMQQHLAEMDVLDLPPLTEPDPGLPQRARTAVGRVITQRRTREEPPVRFAPLLSDGTDVHELAQKLTSPDATRHLGVINGPAGSGRTTLLLDLAAELINQPSGRVPLMLPASVWNGAAIHADRRRPEHTEELGQRAFTRLLLQAVNKEYGLPPEDTRQLLFQGDAALLIDDSRLTRVEVLRFLHLVNSFREAYPKVGLVLAADLAALPEAVRDTWFGPQLFEDASTTRIMPLEPGTLTSAAYAAYVRPLTEFEFPSGDNESLVTTFGQLHRLVDAARVVSESQRRLADVYLVKALALGPEDQRLRRDMQKIAWLRRGDKGPSKPPFLGIRSPRWTLTTPRPLASAEARCTTPTARGLILAIAGAYAIAPRLGTSTALLGSLILILLDITWLGLPDRVGVGVTISLRQRCAALVLGAALGLALGWTAFELRGPLAQFVTTGWTPPERSMLFPVSAGITVGLLSFSVILVNWPDRNRLMFWIPVVTGLATAAALYFASPRAPAGFLQGFFVGVTAGAALCLMLCLTMLFDRSHKWARQRLRPLIIRVAITAAWFASLCAVASWGHPGGIQLWPTAGLILGYCSVHILLPVMMAPAGLIYGPALWFLAASSGFLPWRLAPALHRAQASGWILPGRSFYDPLVQRFLASEAEDAWSLPPTEELFPRRVGEGSWPHS